jgi:hypothetical protein
MDNDKPIAVGHLHRVLRDVRVLVRDYDSMSTASRDLRAGDLFRAWEPMDHWRGQHVPITIGADHTSFDWGVTSYLGHFLSWRDYFERCEPVRAGE